MAAQTVSRMAGAEASPQFFLLDKDGLITTERKVVDPAAAPFAKAPGEIEGLGLREGANLVEMVKRVKPHVLLGLSGVEGIFNEQDWDGSSSLRCSFDFRWNVASSLNVFEI
ncbi:NAD-dependent malic enzyme 59 kDa isoform, mitochondrial-like isoform X6 [Camellia sinensis]|uniref:NAD-dependent malic enzyme 59 kDa isoform, mitochondrial-like isoform X6 n=1 Tax=Camellia sinensis TaxID=4442 RepID=UPI001036F2E0|nr:NAD-dependent malic enzyme 59 kDa isoform, mitochondrial-like isoform X6 [Camellia sinensis]XP_028101696.1 NAD-dependent malic enzyme 59 kDa isoform, mitochondrial-like isoform X6 [Camellia sinensis]XP_028101704.1 NAD-dependent malic enzyme 59 kDa isoform, mitochondrial-like isoform X6 [Camellia sinensis]XP_028101711.1 NAD-dependent malic enzyme 59 kDa isoform, mitochondrial-like isoform X6 [Camellia sinensis]